MSVVRTLPSVTVATPGQRVPVYSGPAAALLTNTSYYISNGIAVFNVANTFTPNGADNTVQQVNFYNFTTGTYFNGVVANVLWATPTQFAIAFNHANVGSAGAPQADAGNIFPTPRDQFQAVRVEIDKGAGSATIFIGDLNVSANQYAAHLSLTGQIAYVQSGNKVDAHRIYIDTDTSATKVQVSGTY
jgi:hypothetical protein